MDYKFPKITFNHSVHGISSSVVNEFEGDKLVVNMVYVFYVKRKGILKRWDAIKSNFPNLGDMITTVERYRCLKRDKTKLLDDNHFMGYIDSSDPKFEQFQSSRPSPFLQNKKTGKNVVNESLMVTIRKPLLFLTNIRDEMERVMKVRDFIYAENTRLAAVDRINKLMGNQVMPEFQPDDLERLEYLVRNNGSMNVDDGLRFDTKESQLWA